MKNGILRIGSLLACFFSQTHVFASTSAGGTSLLLGSIIAVSILLVLGIIVMVGDNLISIEAKQSGLHKQGINLSVLPGLKDWFAPKLPDYVGNEPVTVLRKGANISLLGEAVGAVTDADVKTFAIQPPNFRGISPIPKMEVAVGDTVKAGDPLFFDKSDESIKYVAPVSGEIIAINRGEKRSIIEIVILADKKQESRKYQLPDLAKASRDELVDFMKSSGAWTLIRQRPFDVIADPSKTPRDIFISTFDTAPLAPDSNILVAGKEGAFQKGLDVLTKLTSGNVFLGMNASATLAPASAFLQATGVQKRWFYGKHPAGNVGVQIHHIAPIKPGHTVWTLSVQDVITLGNLFTNGTWDSSRVIALTGPDCKSPGYVRTFAGANIGDLVKEHMANDHVRLISGDVLAGRKKTSDHYLNYYDDQVTVIKEGDYYEIFGWLLPQKARPSFSGTYPNALFPNTKLTADTNNHGERRAFVVTGQYEALLPMDIYPQHLLKAIIVGDYEQMEGLGIHELIEEDIALCEFACTSKQPLQKILREGLDLVAAEG